MSNCLHVVWNNDPSIEIQNKFHSETNEWITPNDLLERITPNQRIGCLFRRTQLAYTTCHVIGENGTSDETWWVINIFASLLVCFSTQVITSLSSQRGILYKNIYFHAASYFC